MNLTEFLAAVLPPEGTEYYCAVELSSRKKEHAFVNTIAALATIAEGFDASGRDAYFALASYAEGSKRTSANSSHIRCLFADVDAGEGKAYSSSKEAAKAVLEWGARVQLPTPYLVASGGGIHAYWPFTTAVSVDAWRPVAENFKRACVAHGLQADYSVSGDSARVLRVPGTFNRKKEIPRPVQLRVTGTATPFEELAKLLEEYEEKKPILAKVDSILDNAPAYAKEATTFVLSLAEITETSFERIVGLGDNGCLQIMNYIRNATADGMEPVFRGCISIAKFSKEGEAKALELGAMHPYDTDRTLRKYHDIKGPYLCKTFEQNLPGGCDGCLHRGKIKSPILLGRQTKEAPEILAAPLTSGGQPAPLLVSLPEAPPGYVFFEHAVAQTLTEPSGMQRTIIIADTPFWATATYDREGERYVQFEYMEHGVIKAHVMPMAVATGRDEAIKAFAKVGIVVSANQETPFRVYVKNTIAEAKKNPPLPMPTNLGWQQDDTFVFNNRIFTRTTEHVVPMYGFDNINETTGVVGTLDGWRLVVAGIKKLERWDMLAMMTIGFAAPLMKFTGLNGVTFHLCGNDSGRGKTLCQRLASSVWGNPDKFRITPNTSPLAMVNRLGMLGNLPLMVDEITHKGRNDSEWFPEFLSQMSDGRGKDRMESSVNAERRKYNVVVIHSADDF